MIAMGALAIFVVSFSLIGFGIWVGYGLAAEHEWWRGYEKRVVDEGTGLAVLSRENR